MLKLCRICGNPGIFNIYNLYDDNSICLANKINSFVTLQVSIFIIDVLINNSFFRNIFFVKNRNQYFLLKY